MKVTLTRAHNNPPPIRQALPRRDWMDETYKKHAYKCLPMTSANINGWELELQQEVIVQVDAPPEESDHYGSVPRVLRGGMITHTDGNGGEYVRPVVSPSIINIISFDTGWSMKTPEGVSTWITGTPNYFVDGAVPLTASIPTGWWPDQWNMNWLITKFDTPVVFPKGMPFMFFQFYHDDLMPSVEFDTADMGDDPKLREERAAYGAAKAQREIDEPWVWAGGIRTGLNEKDERIGPKYGGHPILADTSKCPVQPKDKL